MPEQNWDERLLEYVRRTGEDLKRTGEEFLEQTQRTFDDLRDPAQQERWKARVGELRTWAMSKFEEARSRAVSSSQPAPFLRQASQPVLASARAAIGEPSRAKMCGASAPKSASICRHACASARENPAARATVVSRSLETPNHLPSRIGEAKQCSAGTKARPSALRPSPCSRRNGEPAKRLKFIA